MAGRVEPLVQRGPLSRLRLRTRRGCVQAVKDCKTLSCRSWAIRCLSSCTIRWWRRRFPSSSSRGSRGTRPPRAPRMVSISLSRGARSRDIVRNAGPHRRGSGPRRMGMQRTRAKQRDGKAVCSVALRIAATSSSSEKTPPGRGPRRRPPPGRAPRRPDRLPYPTTSGAPASGRRSRHHRSRTAAVRGRPRAARP